MTIVQAIEMSAKIYKAAQKNGYVEIMTRNAKGQIEAISKCLLNNTNGKAAQAVVRNVFRVTNIVNPAKGIVDTASSLASNVQIEMVRRAVKENGKMLKELSSQVGMLSASMKGIAGVSWLNTGLSLVNVGVSVAGFMMMNSRLENMSASIDAIAKNIQDVKDIQIETNFIRPYKKLVSESKVFCYRVANGENISEEKLETLIKEYYSFLDSVFRISDKIDMTLVLQIVYDLLPVFVNLIVLYNECFYYSNGGKLHPLYDEWMHIFDIAGSKAFTDRIMDHYYLCGYHNAEVNEIMTCNTLLQSRLRTKLEDTVALLEMSGDAETYAEACKAVNRCAAEAVRSYREDLMGEYSEEEADTLIRNSTMQAIGMAV